MQSIELIEDCDEKFAALAQLSTVTGTILPSGLEIPDDGHWFIQGNYVIKRLRLAFAGPMASGKSTVAKKISKTYGCRVKSFATPVKEIACETFGMTTKDGLRDFQDTKCDIIGKYSDEDVRNLRAYGEIPTQETVKQEETEPFDFDDI